jgi:hypothetical protein
MVQKIYDDTSISTSTVVTNIQNTVNTFENMQNTIQDSRANLINTVDQNIAEINSGNTITSSTTIKSIRESIISNINDTLTQTNAKTITQEKINELGKIIKTGLDKINDAAQGLQGLNENQSNYAETIDATVKLLSQTIEEQVTNMVKQGGDLLYKDSNNDGISDFDSVHVYNIDPVKPSATSTYEGKTITAGEKVLLGYDPKETALVKVIPEEPASSTVKETSAYKVEDVKLTVDKKITISGKVLPNSYTTLYIYSTPIIVTVKADANGDWQYTLDKELDDGEHTIYTATVNNTGKILAKSSAFTFVKTAEAATLGSLPPVQVSTENAKPAFFTLNNIYIIGGILLIICFLVLIIIGKGSKKVNQPLLDYIRMQTQRGFTKEVISNELLTNGWTMQDIEDGFKKMGIPINKS